MTRRQRRDLRVKLFATQSWKSSHCPFLLLNVSRKAVNTNFYSLCFDVLGIEPRSANRFSSRRSIYSTTDRNIYLFSCHWTASDANLVDDPHTFHCNGFFVIGGIRCSCFSSSFQLGVSNVPVVFFEFLSTEFAACLKPASRNNHRKEEIPLIQERNNVTRVPVEPRSFDQGSSVAKGGLEPPHWLVK